MLSEIIPEDYDLYRGNLTLPDDAGPDDHKRAKRNFLQILNRWKYKYEYTCELHAVLDITDPQNAHWDIVGYSDAPITPLKAAVADAWRRAGGKSHSFRPMTYAELVGAVKYISKDTVRPDRARKYLPASHAEMRLNLTWSTEAGKAGKGFWYGTNADAIWKERNRRLYGKVDRNFRLNQVLKLREVAPHAETMLQAFQWYRASDFPQPRTRKDQST